MLVYRYQWYKDIAVKIFSTGQQIAKADVKKSEKHLEKLEEHCKPRGGKLVRATQNKVLTRRRGYIEKCTQISEVCGWPEDAKDMTLRNAILLGLKNTMVYQKEKAGSSHSHTARVNGGSYSTRKTPRT